MPNPFPEIQKLISGHHIDPQEVLSILKGAFGDGTTADTPKKFGSKLPTPKWTYQLPIKFNPGIHNTLLHQGGIPGVSNPPFKGTIVSYGTQYETFDQYRFGLRLHFNPTHITMSTSLDAKVDNSPMDAWQKLNVSPNQQQVSLDLKLRRVADVAETDLTAFTPRISSAELTEIKNRGTLIDIEYLFRAINGTMTSLDGNYTTSDIGYLMYNLLNFNLSRTWKFIGFVTNMVVTHNMFTPDMVPIDSDVHLDVIRMTDTTLDYVPVTSGVTPQPKPYQGANQFQKAV